MKTNKIIYWTSTGLLSTMMLMSTGMYFFKTEEIQEVFLKLGYPDFIVIPLAVAKILGVIAIITRRSKTLLEWTYAGFFFDFVLASSAHLMIQDGEHVPAMVAMVLLLVSYFSGKRI